jgi:hypothetical protein
MTPKGMHSTSHPLVDNGWNSRLKLYLLEFCAMLIAIAAGTLFGVAVAFGFAGWALGENRVPPVAGIFLLWLSERTRGNMALLVLVLVLTMFNIAREDHDGFIRMFVGLSVATISGYVAIQAYRYSRGFRNRRSDCRGSAIHPLFAAIHGR